MTLIQTIIYVVTSSHDYNATLMFRKQLIYCITTYGSRRGSTQSRYFEQLCASTIVLISYSGFVGQLMLFGNPACSVMSLRAWR